MSVCVATGKALTFRMFEGLPWLRAGVSTVAYGNMSYKAEDRSLVRPRRESFLRDLGLNVPVADRPYVVAPSMCDGIDIAWVPRESLDDAPVCDGLITQSNIVLFMSVADCLPAMFVDPVHRAVALVHIGWKATMLRSVDHVVATFRRRCNTNPADLLVVLPPSLQGDWWHPYRGVAIQGKEWDPYVDEDAHKGCRIRFTDYTYQQLLENGVIPQHIERSRIDTLSSPDFFSNYEWRQRGDLLVPDSRHGAAIGILGS